MFLVVGSVSSAVPGPGERVRLHAHNCYPQKGQWTDRIERALATSSRPIVIEQDVVWRQADTNSVVAHEVASAAEAPTLEDYFFERLAPVLDRALAEARRDEWPLVILHLDFKTNEPAHHAAIWALLGKYERWLTTAERVSDGSRVMPFTAGPLLVLTERGAGQEDVFHTQVPIGARLRIFGTVAPAPLPPGREKDPAASVEASPHMLIPSGATNYRRWTNHSWTVIEEGGPPKAAGWTAKDAGRLRAVVRRAHEQGLWIRFYTLNGHTVEESRGWGASYNFGSAEAVRLRWRAAIGARVDFVATDQYEDFDRVLVAASR